MPSSYLDQLPNVSTINRKDILILQQQIGDQQTTHKITVEQLLAAFVPIPEIKEVNYNPETKELTIQGRNLYPNSLVQLDYLPYKVSNYKNIVQPKTALQNKLIIHVPDSLKAGEHRITVTNNFVQEATATYTF